MRATSAGGDEHAESPVVDQVTARAWREQVLPARSESVSAARRFVDESLVALDLLDVRDVANLLTSELVTNAVLYAGSDIRCRCLAATGGIRVEVFDGSTAFPSVRPLGTEASTGRGMALVEALSTAWGLEPHPDGKIVWFELGSLPGAHAEPDGGAAEPPAVATVPVVLREAPVRLLLATIEYGEALMREMALWQLGDQEGHGDAGWTMPMTDLGPVLNAASAATGASTDLHVEFPEDSRDALADRLARTEQADAYARHGDLLTAPAVPEVAACRSWLYGEILGQVIGAEPVPWTMPGHLAPTQSATLLTTDQLETLAVSTDAVVVADDANRIIFVTLAASDLLGWSPHELIGQRLTTIIPPELRADHLAAFTRFNLTGEGSIIGQTVRVPAMRHHGSVIPVDLEVTVIEGQHGRTAYMAVMTAG